MEGMRSLTSRNMLPAHASLAPFGTWWSVATLTPRIEPRDGRAEAEVGVEVEVEVAWGGGAGNTSAHGGFGGLQRVGVGGR